VRPAASKDHSLAGEPALWQQPRNRNLILSLNWQNILPDFGQGPDEIIGNMVMASLSVAGRSAVVVPKAGLHRWPATAPRAADTAGSSRGRRISAPISRIREHVTRPPQPGVPSRGGRRHRASVVAHAVAGALRVTIDRGEGFNSRQLFAGIEINAPAEVVWQALTNYAGLQEFIPGLKENTVVEKRSDGALLRQVGQEDLALGVKFTASVLLDIKEHRRGMPASMASADEDGKVALPVPQSWGGVHASNYMDITFELVDGDFKVFNGVWRMSPGATGPSSSRLSYTVLVQPSPWLPVRLVEGRVSGEIANNLKAVRAYAERKHKEAKSSQVAAASMAME